MVTLQRLGDLRNPKYTGYQVWNRRARKKGSNRINPPDLWIWSEELAHPALVTREEYQLVETRAQANNRSRQGSSNAPRPTARTSYLYRGPLHCGVCGLRMWGNRKGESRYYTCQPSHQRSKNIPDGHPPTVYLHEKRLDTALFGFLRAALFGPERTGYWQRSLDASATPGQAAPAAERATDLRSELADLERRLKRQLMNLEADDTTPALRRRVATRVAELEDAISDRQARINDLAARAATQAPTFADVAPLLDQLPVLADRLETLPHAELRAWFDALQLKATYQPAEQALDVEITLCEHETDQSRERETSEDWSVHLREVLSRKPTAWSRLHKHLNSRKYSKSEQTRLEHVAVLAQTGLGPEDLGRVRLRLRQPNHKLRPAEVDELVRRYIAGESMRSLAKAFTLYDKTVRAHLLRRGVELRQTNVAKRYRGRASS